MPFPEVERVVYENNPLDNVICQLRYPTIIKIETELPADFQNEIIGDYPVFDDTTEFQQEVSLSAPISPDLAPSFVSPQTKISSSKNYVFSSVDGNWTINLTKNFISLSNKKYTRWEEYKERLSKIATVFERIYNPTFYSRIGLRYIDIFERSKHGLADTAWSELITPSFLGLLSKEFEDSILNFNSVTEIALEDNNCAVKLVSSLVRKIETNEQCYLLDSDFFTRKREEKKDVLEKLEYLHKRSTRLVRLVITDKLHQAMRPKTL